MPSKKIAIIGSGIAGLSAAYWLGQQTNVQVTLIERSSKPGMDAHRVDLQENGDVVSVDVPSRMFNSMQWPHLKDLYDGIGVKYEPVDASQSITKRSPQSETFDDTYLKLNVAFRPLQVAGQLLRANSRQLLSEANRLMKEGRLDLDRGIDDRVALGDYLNENGYSDSFKTEFLYPTLSSTVCTCSYRSLDQYPANVILETLRRLTDDRDLLRTSLGTRDVVARLSRGLTDIRVSCSVVSIECCEDKVAIIMDDGQVECFDHVILATQANTALSLQARIPQVEANVLKSIPYEDIHVVVHRDQDLMPVARSNWRTFNMLCQANSEGAVHHADCTVWLNRFDPNCRNLENAFQTISAGIEPEVGDVIASFKLQRPAVNAASLAQLKRLEQIQLSPDRRVWYCGSWAVPGVPLLETAVVSAKQAVDRILETSRTLC